MANIRVEIDPLAEFNNCFKNCAAKVARDGGRVVLGWRKTSATPLCNLISSIDHHAIWESPNGELVDITPRHRRIDGILEECSEDVIEFEIDPSATFEDDKSRPSRYVPSAEDSYGYLQEACLWFEKAVSHDETGYAQKMDYADRKAKELIERHLKRIKK